MTEAIDWNSVTVYDEDRDAARARLAQLGKDTEGAVINLARMHAVQGESRFRLHHGLREPRCVFEAAELEHAAGRVTDDQFLEIVTAADESPVDETILDVVYEDLEWSLLHYEAFLTWVVERLPQNRDRSRTAPSAEYSLREMLRAGCLSDRKLSQTLRLAEDARVAQSLGAARIGREVAPTAAALVRRFEERDAEFWANCRQIAERSRTDPAYLYATTEEELFWNSPNRVRAVELDALLREEVAAARRLLAQTARSTASTHIQNTLHVSGSGCNVSPQFHMNSPPIGAASDIGESAVPTHPPDKPQSQASRAGTGPKLPNWAVGTEKPGVWWLFHKRHGMWQQRSKVAIPDGNAEEMMKLLAAHGGAISRDQALKCLFPRNSGVPRPATTRPVTDALAKAKAAIREAIARAGHFDTKDVSNPIPFVDPGWRARIEIGFAIKNDDRKLVFKLKEEL